MNIIFGSRRLRRAYSNHSLAFRYWGPISGQAYIARVGQIRNAENVKDLFAGPGRFELLTGDRQGQYSLRLGKGLRLIVRLQDSDQTIVILEVSDHYDN